MSQSSSRNEALFADALAQPPAERGAFLAKACGADVDLLAHLVALVAAHETPESLTSPTVLPPLSTMPEEKPGNWIGRYKLLQKIGEGGCGVVWMAEQEEPVRRRIALKVIKLGMDTKEVISRFEAERQALALMDHPNIARVFDGGATEEGRPFFVMELVRGVPITKYCDEQELPTAARLELFTQVCHAIQHAHQKGIIHRDLKPSNILVTENDGVAVPKVIDFGIAKATQGRLTDATLFTAFEQFIGTPAYMSPEQAVMTSIDVDTRSDIYSLGVLLYELLTGRTPFDTKSLVSAGLDEIRRIIREVDPPRPSTRLSTLTDLDRASIARQHGTVPAQLSMLLRGDLDWIVMKALEKNRARRYETANAFALDVLRHLHDEPVLARPPSTAYRVSKFVRRNTVATAAATVVLLTLTGGVSFSTVAYWREKAARDRAVAAEIQQSHERARADEARQVAERARHVAETAEQAATRHATDLRQNLYAADMYLVQSLQREDASHTLAERILRGHVPRPGETDLRGFEWSWLWRQSQGDKLISWPGGQGTIRNIMLSPNGKLIATAGRGDVGEQGHVCVWDAESNRFLAEFKDTECVAFSGDGRHLLTGSRDAQVHVWEVGSWRAVRDFRVANIAPYNTLRITLATSPVEPLVAMCPDGSYSVGQGSVRLFNFETAQEVGRLDDAGCHIAFSPDGQLVATGSSSQQIKIWDVATHRVKTRFEGITSLVTTLQFSPNGSTLFAMNTAGQIRSWALPIGRELPSLSVQPPSNLSIVSFAISPDGKRMATGGGDRHVRIWDLSTNKKIADMTGTGGHIWSLAFSRNSEFLYTGGRDARISYWPTPGPKEEKVSIPTAAGEVAIATDGTAMAVQNPLGTVEVWNLRNGTVKTTLPTTGQPLWLGDGGATLLLERGAVLERWDLSTIPSLKRRVELHVAPETIARVAVSPDGELLALAKKDSSAVSVWHTATGQIRGSVNAHDQKLYALVFSPDGMLLGAGGYGNHVNVWNVATLAEYWTFPAERTDIAALAFSPDNSVLATAGTNSGLRLWSISEKRQMAELPSSGTNQKTVTFSPDGRTLVSGGAGEIAFWHMATGREIASFKTSNMAILEAIHFAADRRSMIMVDKTSTAVGQATLWRVPLVSEIDARLATEARLTSREGAMSITIEPAPRQIETEEDVSRLAARNAAARIETSSATEPSNINAVTVTSRYDLGILLANSGQREEALKELLWCYDEGMPRFSQFMYTRRSPLLTRIAELGSAGIDALRVRRDQAAEVMANNDKGGQAAAQDLAAIDVALKELHRTVEYFEQLPAGDARRGMLGRTLLFHLVSAQRYDEGAKLITWDSVQLVGMQAEALKNRDAKSRAASLVGIMGYELEALAGAGKLGVARGVIAELLARDASSATRIKIEWHVNRAGHPELLSAAPPEPPAR